MKPRIIRTSKILVAAVISTVGCATRAPATSASPAVAIASPGAEAATRSEARAEDPALLALRNELLPKTQEEAFASLAHYRPLCDRDGFPLVGNVARKAARNYKPSEFCGDVRKRETQ